MHGHRVVRRYPWRQFPHAQEGVAPSVIQPIGTQCAVGTHAEQEALLLKVIVGNAHPLTRKTGIEVFAKRALVLVYPMPYGVFVSRTIYKQ